MALVLAAVRSRANVGRDRNTDNEQLGQWVLIEAKANTVEFVTLPCAAAKIPRSTMPEGTPVSPKRGRDLIENTLNQVKRHLGVHRHYPWLGT